MTEQPEQLMRSEIEIAQTHLEKAQTHALSRLRETGGELWHEAHRAHAIVSSAKQMIDQLLKEESR